MIKQIEKDFFLFVEIKIQVVERFEH